MHSLAALSVRGIVCFSTQHDSSDGRVVGGFGRAHTVFLMTCDSKQFTNDDAHLRKHNLTNLLLTWMTLRYALNTHGILAAAPSLRYTVSAWPGVASSGIPNFVSSIAQLAKLCLNTGITLPQSTASVTSASCSVTDCLF